MLIKKLNDEILGEDDKPISNSRLSIDDVIRLLKQNVSKEEITKQFENLKKSKDKVTFKSMLMQGANFIDPNDKTKKTPAETFNAYEVYKKIKKANGQVELSAEDCTLLKDNIAALTGFGVSLIVAGQTLEKLEQKK